MSTLREQKPSRRVARGFLIGWNTEDANVSCSNLIFTLFQVQQTLSAAKLF